MAGCDREAADGWNSTPAGPARLQTKLDGLRAACDRAGRSIDELELSLEIQVLIAPTEDEVKSIARDIAALPASKRGAPRTDVVTFLESNDERPPSDVVDDWLVGTPESVCQQLETYTRLGIRHFMLWFLDYPSLDGMRLFAERVIR